jgi:hypothetical protein
MRGKPADAILYFSMMTILLFGGIAMCCTFDGKAWGLRVHDRDDCTTVTAYTSGCDLNLHVIAHGSYCIHVSKKTRVSTLKS